ncbi:MAG TPA: GxxExxY protein [Geomonas sp.]|nr:GxxExxY protein [Geomonas sp.]
MRGRRLEDEVVIELKAVKALLPEHTAQILNYLRATRRAGWPAC